MKITILTPLELAQKSRQRYMGRLQAEFKIRVATKLNQPLN